MYAQVRHTCSKRFDSSQSNMCDSQVSHEVIAFLILSKIKQVGAQSKMRLLLRYARIEPPRYYSDSVLTCKLTICRRT